jgi:hypothetical protein
MELAVIAFLALVFKAEIGKFFNWLGSQVNAK